MRSPNVANYLENTMLAHPDKPALIFEGQGQWTFRELDETINQVANGLIDLGIKKGDRVTLFLPNCAEALFFYYGIMKMGGIVNPLNMMLKEKELEYIVGDCEPEILVTAKEVDAEPMKVFTSSGNKVKKMIVVDGTEGNNIISYENWVKKYPKEFDAVKVDGDDLAAILYTSGTTGKPKGVMLTHTNLWTNARHCADWAKTTYRDIGVASLPLFHSYALSHVVGELLISGGTIVWQKRFDATATLEALAKYKATCFHGVATMYYALISHPNVDDYAKKIHLRYSVTGAAVTPEPILRAWNEKFTNLSEGYGTTEAAPVVLMNPLTGEGVQKANSCGVPIVPELEVNAFDDNDNPVKIGEIGELVLRGPNIMKGYWKKQEATAEALKNGWYHTGDLVHFDADGYCFVVDRKKDMICRGAFNIYPKEIEDLFYTHPAVAEVQVVGIKELIKGEEVVACIALKPGKALTEEEAIKFCKDNIAAYKSPRYVRFFESLPKTVTGKLEKVTLRQILENEFGKAY
jgi:long-chain acyl-CoA synthetase